MKEIGVPAMSSSAVTITVGTGKLVDAIARVVDTETPGRPQLQLAEQAAAVLRRFLHRPDLLTPAQQEPDPVRYRQHVLHVDPGARFSLVALVWLPGQRTPIHNHTTWCVAGTYRGCEQETIYQHDDASRRLKPVATTFHPVGAVTALAPPGDIHRVRNCGTGLAISIHLYGADVVTHGGSIHRRFAEPE